MSPSYLQAQAHEVHVDVIMHDTLTALRMTDDEMRRYFKEDMTRALAQIIADKLPMREYAKDGCMHAKMSLYAFPPEAFWEIVRTEARRMLNKAVGYPL